MVFGDNNMKNEYKPLSLYLSNVCKRLKYGDKKCNNHHHIESNPYINFVLFAQYLCSRGRRERTIKDYLYKLHTFNTSVKPKSLAGFRKQVTFMSDKDMPENSVKRKTYIIWICLKHYLIAIERRDLIKHLPPKDEIDNFINNTKNRGDIHITSDELNYILSRVSPKYNILFTVMRVTGCRISESLFMKRSWINFKTNPAEINIPTDISKSPHPGTVFLTPNTTELIKAYIEDEKISKHGYLFVLLPDKKVGKTKSFDCIDAEKQEVLKVLRSVAPQRLKNKISPHYFRYHFAKALYKADIDIHKIQLLMRHRSLETTTGYISVQKEDLKRSHGLAGNLLET